MNLTALQADLRVKIGNPSTSQVADSVLTSYLNKAQKRIADRYRFHKTRKVVTFPTVASTDKYNVPSDYNVVMSLADQTNKRPLRKTSFAFINANPSQTNQQPTRYAIEQGYIHLWPTPDAVYTIQMMYRANPTDLSAGSDTPVFPDAWHEGLPLCARHIYWDDNGDVAKARYALDIYNDWLENKTDEIGLEYQEDWEQGVSVPTLSGELGDVDCDATYDD